MRHVKKKSSCKGPLFVDKFEVTGRAGRGANSTIAAFNSGQLLGKVKDALDAAGIDIPFPTRTILSDKTEAD